MINFDVNNVWIGRDNTTKIVLYNEGQLLTESQIEAITKIEVHWDGQSYSSQDYPSAFDFSKYKSRGGIGVKFGLIPFDTTNKNSGIVELIIYDSENQNGIIWGQIKLDLISD